MEAIQIRKAAHNMNLDSCFLLPMVWNPILPHKPPSPTPLSPISLVHACSFLPLLSLILCLFGKHCMPLQYTLVNQSPITYLNQSPTHAQSRSIIGQCLLYSLSLTVVTLVLYAVDKGLRGRNILHQLLLILLRICS